MPAAMIFNTAAVEATDCLRPSKSDRPAAMRKALGEQAQKLSRELKTFGASLTAYPDASFLPAGVPDGFAGDFTGVRFTLAITGRATDCIVERTSGVSALDAASCRLVIEHVVSAPAIRDGRLAPATVRLAVRWPARPDALAPAPNTCGDAGGAIPLFGDQTMPGYGYDQRLLTSDSAVQLHLRVSPTGMPTACDVVRATATPAVARRTCELALATMRFLPARDASGTLVSTDVYRIVRFKTGR